MRASHGCRGRASGSHRARTARPCAGRRAYYRLLAIDHVRRDRQHALGMRRAAVGRVLADLLHELRDDVRRDAVDAVVVVAELRDGRAAFDPIVDREAGLVSDHANLAVFDRGQAVGDHRQVLRCRTPWCAGCRDHAAPSPGARRSTCRACSGCNSSRARTCARATPS